MRQLRPGAGDSGHLLSYFFAVLWFLLLSCAGAATDDTSSQHVENSDVPNPRIEALGTQAPKDLAVVIPRESPTGYGGIRGRGSSMVGGYVGQHRSLDDYEVEDFVLMATVNGTLSARDRKTGKERWRIHTEDAAVQTINHRSNSSSGEPDDMVTWIVEPSEDGELFFYTPDSGLEKLGVTVKDIIHSTPYMPPGADMVYNGAKNTTTYAINARTGVIQRVFSTGGLSGVVNDRKCKTTTKLSDLDDECDSSEGSDNVIMLGRTEYTIRIQRWSTAELLWTIKFNEWSPNNSDLDLRAQYQRPLDNRYIYSQHDGTIFGFDDADSTGVRPPKYHATLESPVVRIFDVVRPLSSPISYDLLVLPQPSIRSKKEEEASQLDDTFVGCTQNGGWYALSEANFPYVTRQASDADCYEKGKSWKSLPTPEREKSLVGIHKVHYSSHQEHFREALPAPPNYDGENNLSGNDSPPASQPSMQAHVLKTAVSSPGTLFTTIVLLIALFPALLYMGPMPVLSILKAKSTLIFPKAAPALDQGQVFETPSPEPIVPPLPSDAPETLNVIATVKIPEAPETQSVEGKLEVQELEEPKPEPNPEGDEIVAEGQVSEGPGEDEVRAPIVRFREPEPVEESAPELGIPSGNGGAETAIVAPTTPKKNKYKRGRRGGKKKSNQANQANQTNQSSQEGNQLNEGDNGNRANSSDDVVGDMVAERIVPGTDRVGRVTVVSTGDVEPDASGGYHILNNLEIWEDELLGTGSQGTTVHKGRWEGKAVAVKRMLTHHVDIAMREVKILQDADFHPNIVRYFCQQQRHQFLYIALEMCVASLYDVIMKPGQFPEIPDDIDTVDAIYQVLQGLNHLHNLKVVHRDVKPQNILVAKPNPKSNRPRFLISDFGLCKKLQQDEYSFGATTAQHAGTIGWRAPELLQDCASSLDAPAGNENSGSGSASGTDIVVDSLTKRRATRAIDIFAMGCVFFFIITRGGHPFGTRWERELNIVRGNSEPGMKTLMRHPDGSLEAYDLISRMIQQDPKARPDTAGVLMHPYFWSHEMRLEFLLTVSDRFELEKDKEKNSMQGYQSAHIPRLERGAIDIVGANWLNRLEPHMKHELMALKRRGYDGAKILDLLRAIRNKKHHFLDMSKEAQLVVGEPPEAYLKYFSGRFEKLLMHTFDAVVATGFSGETRFRKFFTPPV